MIDNVGTYYMLNGDIRPSGEMQGVKASSDRVVYEVIRIMDGVPLFLEDHYDRMQNSMNLIGVELQISESGMKSHIQKLVCENSLVDCNVKVMVYTEESRQNSLLYISKSYYPGKDDFDQGVPVSLLAWERENPNAKIVNDTYKETVSKKIQEDRVFELLLVNNANFITEGSRSNVFFVRESKVYTAPSEHVLKGITRQYVIEACHNAGVELIEELTAVSQLEVVEGLFLSGTSIKALPISRVDDRKYPSSTNPVVLSIRSEFDKIIANYINNHKK